MINCKNDLKKILHYEFSLYFKSKRDYLLSKLSRHESFYIWKYQKTLRKCEYLLNCGKKIRYYLMHRKLHVLSLKTGINIPCNVVKEGLLIYHLASIIINPESRIGENCRIHGVLCIGNKGEVGGASPVLDDHVEIGANVSIIGPINISSGTKIGAGSVVVKSLMVKDATIVGNPAKEIF